MKSNPAWEAAKERAEENYGLVTPEELRELGLSQSSIRWGRKNGRLVPLYPGVDRWSGSPETWRQRVQAARLAAGDAVVARRTAAALMGLLPSGEIELMTTASHVPRPGSFKVIRTRRLTDDDVIVVHGIPATSVPRTLLDLAGVLDLRRMRGIAVEALNRNLVSAPALALEIGRAGRMGRPGTSLFRTLVQELGPDDCLRDTDLERSMFAAIAESPLPDPVPQFTVRDEDGVPLGRPDGAYPELLIGLEADGYHVHSALPDWLKDRRKQNCLVARGWVILRFTHEDAQRPRQFLSDLGQLIEVRSKMLLPN